MPHTMLRRSFRAAAVLLLGLLPAGSSAQSGATQQDSSLDNLAYPPSYRPSKLGANLAVVKRGKGPIDLLLIPGWGFGADVFASFMRANQSRYRMVAVTLPGFGGTAAPPMPAPGTSYGDATWTRAAEEAVARVIEREHLHKPVILGHFVLGTQLAFRLALDHPDDVGGIVIMGGEPMRYTPSRKDSTGKTPASREERIAGIDHYMAPRWFKTVTKQTFDINNYAPAQYSRDSVRAQELWQQSSGVPLPVMVRYLCEYMATDLSAEFPRIGVPTRVLIPSFAPDIFADPKQAYVKTLFIDSWEHVRGQNALITLQTVPDSRIFITDDQPDAVREAIAEVAGTAR